MDINQAVKMMESMVGTTLNCSTQQRVTSYENEFTIMARIVTEFEDGQKDVMEMKMDSFKRMYAKQHFSEKGPIDPVEEAEEVAEAE